MNSRTTLFALLLLFARRLLLLSRSILRRPALAVHVLVMGPMIGLYFLSILFSWLAQKTRGSEAEPNPERTSSEAIR